MTEGERERRTSVPKQLQLFGEYAIDKPLDDDGPTWTSYSAVHVQRTDERFIVRVLRGVNATRRNVIEAFARQAYILESLKHAGIVPIAAAGVDQGLVFIIKPDVQGVTLADKLKAGDDSLTGPDVARFTKEAASVLDYLHRHTPPVVHRDLDPSKILIANSDQKVRVLEVGYVQALEEVARVEPLETPWQRTEEAYRAPEDLPGAIINGTADQYSLATIARACLAHCGAMSTVLKTGTQHVFTRALDPKPTARFPTTGAFATALELAITAALRTASRQAAGSGLPPGPGSTMPKPATSTSTASFAAVSPATASAAVAPRPASSISSSGMAAVSPPGPKPASSISSSGMAAVSPPGPKPASSNSSSGMAAVPRPASAGSSGNEAMVTRRKNTLVGTPPEVLPLPPTEPEIEPTRGRSVPPVQGDTNKWVALGADGKVGPASVSAPPQAIGPAAASDTIEIDSELAMEALRAPPLPRTAGVSAALDLGADDLFGAIPAKESSPSVMPRLGATMKSTEDSGDSLQIDLDEEGVSSSPPPPPRASIPPPGSSAARPAVAPADWRPPEPAGPALATPAVHEITDATPPPMPAVVVPMMPSVPESIPTPEFEPGPVTVAPSERPPPFGSVPQRASSHAAPSDPPPAPKSSSGVRVAWILGGSMVLASAIYVGGFMLRPVLMQLVASRAAATANAPMPAATPPVAEAHPTPPTVAPTVGVPDAGAAVAAAPAADAAHVDATGATVAVAPSVDAAVIAPAVAAHAAPPETPDAGAPATPVAVPTGPLPRHPNNRVRHEVQDQIAAAVEQCPGHVGHHARIHVTYAGPTGQVTLVEFSGSTFTGTPMGECIERAARAVPVQPFSEPSWRTDYTVMVH